MPRIHEGARRKRGIFSLSTPFRNDFSFEESPPSGFGAAVRAGASSSGRDAEIGVREGGTTGRSTFEGGRRCSGVDGANREGEEAQAKDMGEDDSVTTVGEGASVDLLRETPEKSLGDDSIRARRGIEPDDDIRRRRGAIERLPISSPATQTLDRLDAFGSRRGGAELSRLLARKSAGDDCGFGISEREKGEPVSGEEEEEERSPPKTGKGSTAETTAFRRRDDEAFDDPSPEESPATLLKSISASLSKKQSLHSLKEYFMSTQNSSSYARRALSLRDHPVPPAVPFCLSCDPARSTGTATRHHPLCPSHPDFFNSGSYEILNLIVDGNRMGCDACIFHFEEGRPDRGASHKVGCGRGKGGGKGAAKKNSRDQSSLSDADGNKRPSLEEAAEAGCKKCRREVATGAKTSARHDEDCPRKRKSAGARALGRREGAAEGRATVRLDGSGPSDAEEEGSGPPAFGAGTAASAGSRARSGADGPGGVAGATEVRPPVDGAVDGAKCDASCAPETRKEKMAEGRFVSLRADCASPSKDGGELAEGEMDRSEGEDEERERQIVKKADVASINSPCAGVANHNNEDTDVNSKEDNAMEICITSAEKVDIDGNPLSDYELLRLRNIKRNEARLAKLGLIDPEKAKKEKAKQKVKPSNDLVDATGKKRREASLEDAAASGCNKCQQELATGVENRRKMHDNGCPRHISLEDAAASGCAKCVKELATGLKSASQHQECCPRHKGRGRVSLEDATASGCKKCTRQLANGVQNSWVHDDACPRKPSRRGRTDTAGSVDTANGTKKAAPTLKKKNKHQESLKRSDTVSDDVGKPKKKTKHTKEKEYHGDSSSSEATSLVQAAKSRKCTLEWQTEDIDPSSTHDKCPRGGSKRTEGQLPESKQKVPDTNTTDRTPPPEVRGKDTSGISSTAIATRSVTPSPAMFASRIQQPLPSFITEFASQSANKDEVPAPPGSKWLPCSNPWGKIGQEDGDVVIVSPFQSEGVCDVISTIHQGPHGGLPKRFAFNPMAQNSPYLATHKSPARGGYSVLRLKRDRAGMIPWGFTVRIHEFGGACLVDNIELLSPADNAQDISGWEDSKSSAGSSSGLKVHDMIISINGKTVGGMTEPEFQIELDICGPEVMLVVCRFDISEEVLGQVGSASDNALGDISMDWNDIGAVASTDQKGIGFGGDNKQGNDEHVSTSNQPVILSKMDQQKVSCHVVHSKEGDLGGTKAQTELHSSKKKSKTPKKVERSVTEVAARAVNSSRKTKKDASKLKVPATAHSEVTNNAPKKSTSIRAKESEAVSRYRRQVLDDSEFSDESEEEAKLLFGTRNTSLKQGNSGIGQDAGSQEEEQFAEESEDEDDENPWLGCVCGKTHPPPIKVFWVQCETCDAWYNVAVECVGFNQADAENLGDWHCWSCSPPIAGLEK